MELWLRHLISEEELRPLGTRVDALEAPEGRCMATSSGGQGVACGGPQLSTATSQPCLIWRKVSPQAWARGIDAFDPHNPKVCGLPAPQAIVTTGWHSLASRGSQGVPLKLEASAGARRRFRGTPVGSPALAQFPRGMCRREEGVPAPLAIRSSFDWRAL